METSFQKWHAEKLDDEVDIFKSNSGFNGTFQEIVDLLNVIQLDLQQVVAKDPDQFLSWYVNNTRHRKWVVEHWAPDMEAEPVKTEAKKFETKSGPTHVTAISSDGTVVKQTPKHLHWHTYTNQMLLNMAIYLGAEYMPIIADLTLQFTRMGDRAIPSFSFVVDPNEEDMYRNVEAAMGHVVSNMKHDHIYMQNGLRGSAKLQELKDGTHRHMFLVTIGPQQSKKIN